jgi:hypothetical protein
LVAASLRQVPLFPSVVLLVLAPTIWQQSEDVLEFGHAPDMR